MSVDPREKVVLFIDGANLYATSKPKMTRAIDEVKKQRGVNEDQSSGFRLDLASAAVPTRNR